MPLFYSGVFYNRARRLIIEIRAICLLAGERGIFPIAEGAG